ncbi:MAG TPA: VWA domain-containing protein [Blastocatellia bacterium]|nr:VWA domain-containing protein [Blastocatellia bacterium]
MSGVRLLARSTAVALLSALLLNGSTAGQDDQTLKLRADLVAIDVAVTDRNGNFIRNLKAEDFTLFEDGKPQKLDFFEATEETALTRPLAVVFAIDNSGSIKPEEVVKQRQAAEAFMKLVRPESVFAVVAFQYKPRIVQDFTSDPRKISQGFGKIGEPGGNSGIFACIDHSVSMLQRAPRFRDGRRLRRVVVIVSDGYDNVSRPDEQGALIDRANAAEVTVYSITLPSFGPGHGNNRIMTLLDVSKIIPMTGGADFSANTSDFTPVFKAIAEEIRFSYTLAYYPAETTKRDGRVHQLRVEVKKPGAVVRASRTSYKGLQAQTQR